MNNPEILVNINEDIHAVNVRVIDSNGEQIGVMSKNEALNMALSQDLDLIEIVPHADPPVCKIMEYSKYLYEQRKREKAQHQNKKHAGEIKEIRMHPNIAKHDLEFKMKHAAKFIEDGYKVKLAIVFQGREIDRPEQGEELVISVIKYLGDTVKIEQNVKLEGNYMSLVFCPIN